MSRHTFQDRTDAGRQLAERLVEMRLDNPLVVGLPRGGVPVAAEVARSLDAPLDVVVVRKIGVPWQPELAMGAVGENGARVLNQDVIEDCGISPDAVDAATSRASKEIAGRVEGLRAGLSPHPVTGRTVILVDDGIATGATSRAAAELLRRRGAVRIVLATPVAAPQALDQLHPIVDDVVCVMTPSTLGAIGWWYDDFAQVSDQEVRRLLLSAKREAADVATPGAAGAQSVGPESADSLSAGNSQGLREAGRHEVSIPSAAGPLQGTLTVPAHAIGVVVFAHGSGSSRFSPRNIQVAVHLQRYHLATLLFDLLTEDEARWRTKVFDISLLAERLEIATRWLRSGGLRNLPLGYFGASTGAAAALWAAGEPAAEVAAIVSRGGRPDLARDRLPAVRAPTLLIVGGSDVDVLELNRWALERMRCEARIEIVPAATHLFEEPGALEAVSELAAAWFVRHLGAAPTT